MGKPKSELTLAKEAKTKEAIAALEKTIKPDMMPFYQKIPAVKGKLKSPEGVLIRRAQLPLKGAAYWRALRASVDTNKGWMCNPVDSFLVGLAFSPWGNDIELEARAPKQMYAIDVKCGLFGPVSFERSPSPEDFVLRAMFPDEAYAMTWPDDLGKVTLYLHPDSVWAQRLAKVPHEKQSDGLLRDKIKTATDWNIVAQYIDIRKAVNKPIPRRTMCDLVRTISVNLAENELTQEKTKATGQVGVW